VRDLKALAELDGTSHDIQSRLKQAEQRLKAAGSRGLDHYRVLGVQAGAAAAEVKAAYRCVCRDPCGGVKRV
jgi:DnaJ-domain-containing protein 1